MRRMKSMIIPMLLGIGTRWAMAYIKRQVALSTAVRRWDVNQDRVYTALMKYLEETYQCSLD